MYRERLHDLWLRLKALVRRRELDRDLAEELEFHFAMREQKLREQGLAPREAHAAARRAFGNAVSLKETSRDLWSFPSLESLLRDVRFGLHTLTKSPGFAIVAVLTLALGIGGTTAAFSALYAAFLNSPYTDSHRLAELVEYRTKWGKGWQFFAEVPAPVFQVFREQKQLFDEVIGEASGPVLLTGTDVPASIYGSPVTEEFFRPLKSAPITGRAFAHDDYTPGAPPVVILSHKLWQTKFGGDYTIIGRTIVINGRPTKVIGVMPPHFQLLFGAAELWLPAALSRDTPTAPLEHFHVLGHLKPGVSVEQANAEAAVLGKQLAAIYPKDIPPDAYYGAELLTDIWPNQETRNTFYMLLGAAGLVLLAACANVANLVLARATDRQKEIAMRAALGASRVRLACQLLTENLLLALGGTLLGCLFAWNALKVLAAFLIVQNKLPRESVLQINGSVLLFAIGTALLSTLLLGLAPALLAVSRDLDKSLQSGSRGGGQSRRHGKIQNLAVLSEVVVSVVLLSGTALLIRTSLALHRIKFGYDSNNVLIANVELPKQRYKTPEERLIFQMDLVHRVRALPGIHAAALGDPPSPFGMGVKVEIAGKPGVDNEGARLLLAGDDYFQTLGMQMLEGRGFSGADIEHARNVVVINQAFANAYFGKGNPLGRQLKLKNFDTDRLYLAQDPWFEIVGVVASTVQLDLRDYNPFDMSKIYVPYSIEGRDAAMREDFGGSELLHLHTAGDPTRLLNSVRREVMALDKDVPVSEPYFGWTLRDLLNEYYLSAPRADLTLLATFASLGLILTCVGVYSVLSFGVSRRTHEIGVRMALGAEAADVRRWVLKAGLQWLLAGIAIGVAATIALAKMLQHQVWWIKTADPLTLTAVSLLLIAVGLAAFYFPARRATKVDPMVALRYE
jgi:putative ABC transport system permease protein